MTAGSRTRSPLFALLWIVAGCALVVGVLVPNAGRLADVVGRARSCGVAVDGLE